MDRVHEGVHGLGPQEWSMDRGSMFCIRPSVSPLDELDEQTIVFILAVDQDKYKKESSQILQKLSFVTKLLAILL